MLYEYSLQDDLSKTNKSYSSPFYFIGAMMLLGGLASIISKNIGEDVLGFPEMLLDTITTLGGVCFLIVANRSRKLQENVIKYSIQISDDKIRVEYENGSKIEEMSNNEIRKIDFKSDKICIYGKNNSEIALNIELVSPENKRNELTRVLESLVQSSNMISD